VKGRGGTFAGIAFFEWRHAAGRPAFAAAALGLAALGALLSLNGPGSGPDLRNGPYAIAYSAGLLGLFSVFAATLLSAPALLRDVEHRSAEIVFATPVGKRDYLLGRFAGSFLAIVAALALGVAAGVAGPATARSVSSQPVSASINQRILRAMRPSRAQTPRPRQPLRAGSAASRPAR